jgi:hypothetical protein
VDFLKREKLKKWKFYQPKYTLEMEKCSICKGYLLDYMSVDSYPCDKFYYLMKWKRLKPLYPQIVDCMYHCLTSMRESDKAAVENLAEHLVEQTKDMNVIHDLSVDVDYFIPYYMYSSMENLNMKEDIVCINDLLLDYTICDAITSKRWIGHWLLNLWEHMPSIHSEHTRQKNCTYGGAAYGLSIPKQVYRLTPIPQKQEDITTEDTRTQEQKEFDELYC